MSATITGDKALDRKLRSLGDKGARKAAASGIRAGLTVVARAIRSEIPPHMKSIKKSIGSRFAKNRRKGIQEAKAGANVGKKRPKQTPHAHLILAGTQERRTKAGRRTGRVVAIPAVRDGYAKSQGQATERIKQKMGEVIQKEAAKR